MDKKKGIELVLLNLEQKNIDKVRIEAFKSFLNEHKDSGKIAELVNAISDITPHIEQECIRFLNQVEQLIKEEDPVYIRATDIRENVRIAAKLKQLINDEIVLQPESLVQLEEIMSDNKLLLGESVLSKKHFNPNKKIAVGLIWRMIEHGILKYDQENPRQSEKAIVKKMMDRWHIDDLQEFKHKKHKQAYCELADKYYGMFFLGLRKKQ